MIDGGTRLLAELVAAHPDADCLTTAFSFHCIVFSVAVWKRVGPFDESVPVWADADFMQRMYLAGEFNGGPGPRLEIAASDKR